MYSASDITRILRVSSATARRWRKAKSMPYTAEVLLRVALDGELGLVLPEWNGWTLTSEALVSPEGIAWTGEDLEAWAFNRQRLMDLERQAREPRQYTLV